MAASDNARRNLSLQFNRLIPAPSNLIFEAFTDPDLLKAWFAPGNMTVPSAACDLRPGGAYRIEMKPADESVREDHVVAQGVYTRLIPGSQLEYTWAGSWDPAEESHVTVSLYESPCGTTLTLDHDGFQSEQSLHNHHSAWQSSLTKLRELFSVN